jgi:hypothetical protein
MNNFFSQKYNAMLGTLALASIIVACFAYAYLTVNQASDWNNMNSISVTGTGEVTAVPDIATFSFSVSASGTDAVAAQSISAEKMNAIVAYLKEQGVEEKDIKTEGYTMYPSYKFVPQPCAYGMYCEGGESIQDGFEVSQMVSVKVRKTDTAGTLLSGVGEKGATNIGGINFVVDDNEAQKVEARRLAIEDARAQAEALADQLGVKLGEMISYYEDAPYPMDPYYGGYAMDMAVKAEAVPEVPMGETVTKSSVTLSYKIHN